MTNVVVNGNAYSDDGTAARDMQRGGHRDWLLPLIGDVMVGVDGADAAAVDAAASAALAASAAAGWVSTSTTSLTVGTGSQSLTIATGRQFIAGTFVQIMRTSAPTTTYMAGQVTSYDAGTGALVVSVSNIVGSGTHTDWTVALSGKQGSDVTLPTQTGQGGKFLTTDGVVASWAAPVASDYQEFTSSGTWTKPAGSTFAYVEGIGGGASGAARNGSSAAASGGGGGGWVGELFRASDLTATVAVTIGAGGAAVVAVAVQTVAGNVGGDTTFGAYLTAKGGGAGVAAAGPGANGGGSQVMAAASAATRYSGYDCGSSGSAVSGMATGGDSVMGGAGGGAASSSGTGVGGVSQQGGSGGAAVYTTTAAAVQTATTGSAPGGAGGAAAINSASATGTSTSGAGGAGRVRVWSW